MSEIKSKKTYQQINDFRRVAAARVLTSDPEKESKLVACISDLIGNPKIGEIGAFAFLGGQFSAETKKIYRKHAGVDEKGYILKDANNNYMFTKESEEACEQELKELANKEIEFTPSYCPTSDLPNDLLPAEKEIYLGFVIDPNEIIESTSCYVVGEMSKLSKDPSGC